MICQRKRRKNRSKCDPVSVIMNVMFQILTRFYQCIFGLRLCRTTVPNIVLYVVVMMVPLHLVGTHNVHDELEEAAKHDYQMMTRLNKAIDSIFGIVFRFFSQRITYDVKQCQSENYITCTWMTFPES